jgi:predicted house-cleaning noncanonical NTP pyrophosphatase (MazG superfamily)
MGFNLKKLFEELQDILEDEEIDTVTKLAELQQCIKEAKKYAKECGKL